MALRDEIELLPRPIYYSLKGQGKKEVRENSCSVAVVFWGYNNPSRHIREICSYWLLSCFLLLLPFYCIWDYAFLNCNLKLAVDLSLTCLSLNSLITESFYPSWHLPGFYSSRSDLPTEAPSYLFFRPANSLLFLREQSMSLREVLHYSMSLRSSTSISSVQLLWKCNSSWLLARGSERWPSRSTWLHRRTEEIHFSTA